MKTHLHITAADNVKSCLIKKWAIPDLFNRSFLVFSNKHCNLFNKSTFNYVHPVSGDGTRTHGLLNTSLLP